MNVPRIMTLRYRSSDARVIKASWAAQCRWSDFPAVYARLSTVGCCEQGLRHANRLLF
jgi:hypothetical protein